jgi:hypothetical protein
MNDIQMAATVLSAIAVVVSAFQIALTSGAPWGEWAFGGQNPGVLPKSFRITSGLSIIVYALQIIHFGSRAGWWVPVFGEPVASILDWIFVAFFALGTVMNGISRSRKERFLWTPVVAISLACALWIAW